MMVVVQMGIVIVVTLGIAVSVQTWRLDVEQAEHKLTRRDLVAAERKALEWKEAEGYRHMQTAAQHDLGKACLDREKTAETDAGLREAIMGKTRKDMPGKPNADKETPGVSRETRRAAADYLNRPL
jgi:hypothetical protein